ncbi:Gfo/Idh/MocA family oxidoreductase [Salibacter sp.]|jgi:predicted dehydrogenase|uniref:Gfo/Idh/MocA family protein n=1 Tax=Salibacter sp. TaxID=2010995 RepID=UPI002870751A|nr:Gfo/Idh/MocA family oxidoreductase [Salibacter sp.]MDR9399703.1 Gfo/Idh/MocA family oxidoreductase [Salibacter sp.]MDR9488225.1 Gfo/Idh/MocA family oxidoreductase [Salibacter sp.]
MLKVGVLGAGHLGKIHLKLLKELTDEYELIGFYDPNAENAQNADKEFGIKAFPTIEELIEKVDVVDIVTPTLSHFDCANMALRNGKHIFIEKPVTNSVDEAKKLIALNHEANVKIQVGHVERFNPAFKTAKSSITQPMFIETHRLAQFNPRGTDVSVILDLMIHDLDIVLSMVNSGIKKISASGVAVVSDNPDICNARIEFDNGCVANLTASRISMKNMRKTRIFQRDAYISVDFLEKDVEIVKLHTVEGEPDPLAVTIDPGNGKKPKEIEFNQPKVEPHNAIKEELRSFAKAIGQNQQPEVTLEDGYKALEVAHQILDKLKVTPNLIEE